MTELAEAVGRVVLEAAGVGDGDALDAPAHLAIIAASARAEGEARDMLHASVIAARAGGVSWARIGKQLGMTRQAAQQRFGAAIDEFENETERWLGPVTAFDEMRELEIAGRAGWHTVEAGLLSHRMVRGETQWQHRRVLWRASGAAERAEGWQVGCRAFPWVYLVRDTGLPIQKTAGAA
ncbi:hypothetical protein ET475_13500 [Microbacterium protaetiae]|uniref:Uncharacterized protein n=1 Tax=Microbacterium protaetiae TaxID=2509458 RepID=A0A4P6EHC3_9MICO|nr:hypothetical protein [Microbacterium protaetiae]QAY60903.1 hypothetical protein ET475_13500 [Microbacterium protaetiae]